MIKKDQVYLEYILEAITKIESFTKGISRFDFDRNVLIQDAIIRNIEIIGEASKKIPVDFKLKWNLINWKNMAGMRDRLIHDYMGINYSIVWDVIKNKIPELYIQITEVLEKE